MIDFMIKKEDIIKIVDKYVKVFKIPSEMAESIYDNIKNSQYPKEVEEDNDEGADEINKRSKTEWNIFTTKDTKYNFLYYDHYLVNTILYLLTQIILQVFIILVIYYFSPALFAVSDIISPMLSWINSSIKNKEKNSFILIVNAIGYLIVLFAAFIYNEMIVCNFYGLDEYTRKAIDERAQSDADIECGREST